MVCSNCKNGCDNGERFCRRCGADLGNALVAVRESLPQRNETSQNASIAHSKDPDELTGNGIGKVFVGDGFLMVAVILSATQTAVSSLLWLLLLIPAFFFFGKGFADILLARQILKRSKPRELDGASVTTEPPRALLAEVLERHTSAELVATPSVTERTTRHLK